MLNPSDITDYQEHGAIVLRGLFCDWVETLARGVEANQASPSRDVRIYKNEDGTGLFFGDYCNWNRIAEYHDFLFNSAAAAIAAELTGSRNVRLFHEHVLVKEPGTDVVTPWHQDQPYYCVDGNQTCSMWLPLDPVPQATCPEFVGGSHRWERWFRPERFDRSALNDDDGLEPVPDIDGNRDRYDIRSWQLEPGDAIAFHFRTVHGAPANPSPVTRRRAFSSRWIGDDCRYARRTGVTSPPFRDVTLEPGAPMDCEHFPLIFTR